VTDDKSHVTNRLAQFPTAQSSPETSDCSSASLGRRRDLARTNVGIVGGQQKCLLAIIAMSPLHRRRIRSAASDPRGTRRPGGVGTRRDDFV